MTNRTRANRKRNKTSAATALPVLVDTMKRPGKVTKSVGNLREAKVRMASKLCAKPQSFRELFDNGLVCYLIFPRLYCYSKSVTLLCKTLLYLCD